MSAMVYSPRRCAVLMIVCLMMSGCQKPGSMIKSITAGTAIGAGAGAVAMVATGGCIGCGAAVGAAVGATLGVAFDALENKR